MTPHQEGGAQELARCLLQMMDQPVLRKKHGKRTEITLSQWLYETCAHDNGQLSEQIEALQSLACFEHISRCPVLGVVGELNTGKSSLVSVFLSPQGRARLPRGKADDQGTHRFVYWLPQKWQQEPIFKEFLQLLKRAHKDYQDYELLPSDPREAASTYRSGEESEIVFRRPVIAFDSRLDELNCAILDCPDIVTRTDCWSHNRLQFVLDAAQICSVIVLVCEYGSTRDSRLGELARGIDTKLWLAVNMVGLDDKNVLQEKEDWHVLREDLTARDVFYSYDFRHEGVFDQVEQIAGHSPVFQENKKLREAKAYGQYLPVFIRLENDQDLLEDQVPQLDIPSLQRKRLQELERKVRQFQRMICRKIPRWAKQQAARTGELQEKLFELCDRKIFRKYNGTDDTEGERYTPINAFLLKRINEAIYEKAPWWAKPGLKVGDIMKDLGKGLRKFLLEFLGLPSSPKRASEKTLQIRKGNFRGLFQEIFPDTHLDPKDRRQVEKAWREVTQQVAELEKEWTHDEKLIQECAEEVWRKLPRWQGVSLIFAGLAPVLLLLAVVDGGATLAGSLMSLVGLSGGIASSLAAMPGMMMLVGASVVAAAGVAAKPIAKEFPNYFAATFYLLCGVFGLPIPEKWRRRVEGVPTNSSEGKKRKLKVELPSPQEVGIHDLQNAIETFLELEPLAGEYEIDDSLKAVCPDGKN